MVIFDVVGNGEFCSPAVVNDAHSPKPILGILPPLKDDFAVEHNLTSCGVEEDFTAGVN